LLPLIVCSLAAAEKMPVPLSTTWNVREAGAVGDGESDHTAVFQRLLNEAHRAGGGVVYVPAGRYVIKGNLSIPAGVTLQGTYRVPPTVQRNAARELSGSVLLAYAGRGQEQSAPFIRLAGNNGFFRKVSSSADKLELGFMKGVETEFEEILVAETKGAA